VESLTDDVEAAALALMEEVAARGGAVAAIEQGYQKGEIEQAAYRIAQQIDAGERVVVGVNRFTLEEEEPYVPLRVDPVLEQSQANRLARLRRERDSAAVSQALDTVRAAARGVDNVLPPLKAALALGATVGEVCDALREVWGSYVPSESF
jgi:methylmalonyl-CoA mutase N-terminal domain/subunit